MIAERLRKSILKAAIQGKLTEQLPEDGDAKDLLAKIRAEKEWLIKEGKIKREKVLPEIKEDEIPFEIPENWCWVRLGEVGYSQTGTTPATAHPEYYGSDMPFIKPPYIYNNHIDYLAEGLSTEGVQKGRLIPANSILMVCIGGSTGKTFYSDRYVCCNQQINTLTPYGGIETAYLLNVLQSQFFQEQLWGLATGTATTIVNKENWRQLLIPIPPTALQRRIVDSIDNIKPHIFKLNKDEELLDSLQKFFPKKMKESLLQSAIQGKLTEQLESDGYAHDLVTEIQKEKARLIKEGKIKKEKDLPVITEDEIPFDIPENWCWVRLGNVLRVNPRNHFEDDKEVSFVPMASINEGYTSRFESETRKWKSVKSGFTHFAENDVVLAKITPCFQNLKSAVMSNLINGFGAGTTELHVLRRYNDQINSKYLLYFLKNSLFIRNGVATMKGTAGQQRVSTDFLKECLFPLPPLAEQHRIVERLDQLLPLCDALE